MYKQIFVQIQAYVIARSCMWMHAHVTAYMHMFQQILKMFQQMNRTGVADHADIF